MTAIVSLRHVSRTFTPQRRSSTAAAVTAVDDVSLDIEAGSVTGIIGYSGAGKSTLVRLINALELPDSGVVEVGGREVTSLTERELRRLRSSIGMVFQQFNLLGSRTVEQNVEYPLRIAGWDRAERSRRVAELLAYVGMSGAAHRFPGQLSGGQKQRVGIARALATRPSLLLADEATSALDPNTTTEVLELLQRVNRDTGTTIVVITHEMHVVRSICDTVAVMEHGRLLDHGPVYDVFAHPRFPETRRFIESTIQDAPTPATIDRLRAHHPGTFVTVSIVDSAAASAGPSAQQQVLETLARHRSVSSGVVFGSVVEITERPYGSLTYALDGPPDAVRALVDDLAASTSVTVWPAVTPDADAAPPRPGGTALVATPDRLEVKGGRR
ncbi:methionine ABC transporter ATP-binding protein [Raineyella sp. LH-20]|uniref:methionine ABC transporter ATP-binding protein n=1 Tax=Raineyella sp. LH-20 TaxID=3081204 RepID=UPI002955AFF5|nr:methionine ABC transporter ATP-binding protein [Raineyella sp. LH-20]WOP18080.1 methionine ABC transporter ATP-binding protein [Raineyella sp. LH-20]